MKLSICKITVGEQCIFNTLKLSAVVDQKHIDIDTFHFKDGVQQGQHTVYRSKSRLTLKNRPQKIILIAHPQIVNLRTHFVALQIFQSERQIILMQSELGDIVIEYKLELGQYSPSPSTTMLKSMKKSQASSQQQVSQFSITQSKISQCNICNHTQHPPQYRPSVQQIIKQNVQLKFKLNHIKDKQLKQTKNIMQQIEQLQIQSKSLVVDSLRKKRRQQQSKNDIEQQRLRLMKKILHLRDLLHNVQRV